MIVVLVTSQTSVIKYSRHMTSNQRAAECAAMDSYQKLPVKIAEHYLATNATN